MAKTRGKYNKIDYTTYTIQDKTDVELRKMIKNASATINQRIKAVRKTKGTDKLLDLFLNETTNDFLGMLDRIQKSNSTLFTNSGLVRTSVKNISKTRTDLEQIAQDVLDMINLETAVKSAKSQVKSLTKSNPEVVNQIKSGNDLVYKGLKKTIERVSLGDLSDYENEYIAYDYETAREAGYKYNENQDSAAEAYLTAVGKNVN